MPTPVVTNSMSASYPATGGASLPVTLGFTASANNSLICIVDKSAQTDALTGITDDAGNTWSVLTAYNPPDTVSGYHRTEIWGVDSVVAATTELTLNLNSQWGGDSIQVVVMEVTNLDLATTDDIGFYDELPLITHPSPINTCTYDGTSQAGLSADEALSVLTISGFGQSLVGDIGLLATYQDVFILSTWTWVKIPGVVQLARATYNVKGVFYYQDMTVDPYTVDMTINFGDAGANGYAYVHLYNNEGFNAANPHQSPGYKLLFLPSPGSVILYWNNGQIASAYGLPLNDGNDHVISVTFSNFSIQAYVDGVNYLSYNDSPRTLPGDYLTIHGRSGTSSPFGDVRLLDVTTTQTPEFTTPSDWTPDVAWTLTKDVFTDDSRRLKVYTKTTAPAPNPDSATVTSSDTSNTTINAVLLLAKAKEAITYLLQPSIDVLTIAIVDANADVLIAETYSLSADLNVIVALTVDLTADLSVTVAERRTLDASMSLAVSVPRNLATQVSVTVAGSVDIEADMSVNVGCVLPGSTLRTVPLSVAIAEPRSLPAYLSVLIGSPGVRTDLDVLVQGRHFVTAGLSVNIKSPTLEFGASAIYNTDGDEVESLLFVRDGGVLHPEWISTMTATLLYRGEHDLGSVTFDCNSATGDGDVQSLWLHPMHVADLTVRYSGTVDNYGAVTFDVPVTTEAATATFIPQHLEGVDNVQPRTEHTPYSTTTRALDAAPEEIDVIDDSVILTLVALDLVSDTAPLAVGNGPVNYSGGGNRLLPSLNNDGTFVYQPAGILPHDIEGYTVLETSGTNLLSNTDFLVPTSASDAVPFGYTLASSSTVTTLPELVESGDVNTLKIRAFGSGPYVGPKSLTLTTSTVPIAIGPVNWSVLARLEYPERTASDIPLSVVKVDTLRLIVSFRDGGDTELSKQITTFDTADITTDSFVLVQSSAETLPLGTVGVRASLQLESIEESDDVNLWLMGPQIEAVEVATSRMVGAGSVSRAADVLRLPQPGNIELSRGSVQIDVAAGYDETPPADACLFDTRTGGFNGLACYHMQGGKLRFVVAGTGSSDYIETVDSYAFAPGVSRAVSVSWDNALRSIWLDGEEVAVSAATVVLPGAEGDWIYLGNDAAGTARFGGVVTGFEVQREPQD